MRALAEFAGALARELNDPMSIVQGRLELLLELGESDPAAVERNLRVALDHARRISAALRNLRLVGQAPAPALVPVLVSDAVGEALDLVGPRQRAAELRVDLQPADLTTGGDLALCARVIANLLNYALEAVSRGTRVELRGRRVRDRVVLRVLGGAVTGSSLGEPLDVDSSLGLSVARTLATSIGGELDARKIPGGVSFTVSLPAPPDRPARARRSGDRLLVVGREPTARSFETLLHMDGVQVVRCPDGEGALALLDGGEDYDAVATELFLDGMSGLTFAQEATKRHPDMTGRLLLVTDARLGSWPAEVVAVTPPLDRTLVLEALGRRVRRRRT
jgi:CheY-like chemotaxis protein